VAMTAREYGEAITEAIESKRFRRAMALVEQAAFDLQKTESVGSYYPQPLTEVLVGKLAERVADRIDFAHGIIYLDQLLRTPLSLIALTDGVGEIGVKEITDRITESVGRPLWSILSPGAHAALAKHAILTVPDLITVDIEFLEKVIYDPHLRREVKIVQREVIGDQSGNAEARPVGWQAEEEL